jgi:hypothetical protein
LDLAKEIQANKTGVGIRYLSVIFVRIETARGKNRVVGELESQIEELAIELELCYAQNRFIDH